MTSEERRDGHMEKFETLLDPDEELLFDFSGVYNSGSSYGKKLLTGTILVTHRRMLFTGKPKFSAWHAGYAGYGKSGKVITIPLKQVVKHYNKKVKMIFVHTAEHEGKKPGKTRKVEIAIHNLKDTGQKKEPKLEWIDRATKIYADLSDLIEKAKARND